MGNALRSSFGDAKQLRILGWIDEEDCQAFYCEILDERLASLKKLWEKNHITIAVANCVNPVLANRYIQEGKHHMLKDEDQFLVDGWLGCFINDPETGTGYREPTGPYE